MNKYMKIAHKGYSIFDTKKNNSISFMNAIYKNFDIIELDLISNFKKNLHFICIEYSSLNKNFIKKLKQENILVFTYTCTNFEVKTIMEKFDIDGICSDIEL